MKILKQSSRARGSNRGGCGGGYERTDDLYAEHKLARMKRELLSLESDYHRTLYLDGLNRYERKVLTNWLKTQK